FGAKDLFDTAGIVTASGSRTQAARIPERDAAAVARMREAGAILLGKTRLHEFGLGDQLGDVTLNPFDVRYTAAGSSSGSAAAVATGMAAVALGTDTCGSVISPAARCGVVGMKP